MRLYDHLKIAELEERIQEWQDAEEEASRNYLSGECSLKDKLWATSFAEKNIMRLKQKMRDLVDEQTASLSKRLRDVNKIYTIR